MKALRILGRLIFGGFFLYSGINHIKKYENFKQYAGAKNVPVPETAVGGATALLLLGGSSMIFGAPKLGAAAIAAFLASVSPMMHDFWAVHDPHQKQNELINFSKNMALLGAALVMMGHER